MRVRRKFPARLSHRMNHASAPLAKDMKLNVRSYSTILYRNVNIKKRPAALAAGRLSSYYRIRWYECQKVFWHSFDTRIATQLRCSRNPPNIRNPLIYCVNRYFLIFGVSQVQKPYRASTNSFLTFWHWYHMMLGSKGLLPPTDAYELLRCKAAPAIL